MPQFTAPASVSQNIARAKSQVKRDEPLRALDALITALELFEPEKIIGKARYEVEVNILECVTDLGRVPKVRDFLTRVTRSDKVGIAYAPGGEKKLLSALTVLRKGLQEADAEKIRQAGEKIEHRKTMLLEKAKASLAGGETPRGKAVLRQLGDEFGHEPGVLALIGSMLLEAKLQYEAVEFLEQALELFPKESKVYADLVNSYTELKEYEKAEAVYLKAIKQFGQHPKTLLNLARLYLLWNKKDQAFEAAGRAAKLDPGNQEARELMEKTG
jgi:tetratricopeptide (TPR) repeat protein